MGTAISVATAPSVAAANLVEVKGHLRVDHDDEDQYIANLIKAAANRVEQYTGRRLITQTLDIRMSAYMLTRVIKMPVAPVSAITEIVVETTAGEETVDSGDYELVTMPGESARPAILQLLSDKQWPAASPYLLYPARIRVTAGYGDTSLDVPESLRQAIYTIVGGWFEARQDWLQGGVPGTPSENAMISDSIMDPFKLNWAY